MDFPERDDIEEWLVYGDWLQMQRDVHERALGEAIALEAAPASDEVTRQAEALVKEHSQAWLGPLADHRSLSLYDWRGGFPRSARVYAEVDTAPVVGELIGHRMGARLQQLEVELADYDGSASLAPTVRRLADAPRPPPLRRLVLAEPPNLGSPWETEPPHIGDAVLHRLALGSRHSGTIRAMLELIPRFGVLTRLEALDLVRMRIRDDDAVLLARHAVVLAPLPTIRLNIRDLSAEGQAVLHAQARARERSPRLMRSERRPRTVWSAANEVTLVDACGLSPDYSGWVENS